MSVPMSSLPGPSPVHSLAGIARHGFLGQTGRMWREHGDLFRLRLDGAGRPPRCRPRRQPDSAARVRQAPSYDGVRRYLVGDGLVASTGNLWRRQRKLLAPLFTPKGVQAYAEVMLRDGSGWPRAGTGSPTRVPGSTWVRR